MKSLILLIMVFGFVVYGAILPTSRGGTGANLSASLSAGGVVNTNSSGFGVTPAASPNYLLQEGPSGVPVFSAGWSVPAGGTVFLGVGGTSANTAPIFIPAGSSMTTAQPGAIESNGTNLYWTNSSGARFKFNFTAQ